MMQLAFIRWNLDPVIVHIGHFPVKYYSLLFGMGVVLGYFIVRKTYLREGKSSEPLDALLTYVVLGIVIGARLGHCLFYEPEYYLQRPLEMLLPIQKIEGSYQFTGYLGLASHGGAIGVFLAVLSYCRKYRVNIWWLLDKLALAAPVTGLCIRLGNFMNSEILGEATGSNFGIIFERVDQVPRHPAQLYEASAYLIIFLFLNKIYRSGKRYQDGFLFGLLLVLLFTARFIIEFFKINQVQFEEGMFFNMGQWLSLPFILIGIVVMFQKYPKDVT